MSDSAAGSAAVAAAPMGATAASASLTHTRTASSSAAAASAADSAGLRPSHAQAAQAAPASPGGSGGGSHSRQPSSSATAAAGGSGHPQLVALRKIDALSEKLQKEGKLLEALQCMEKSLILRGHIFGLDSVEVFRACKSVGEMANFLAMTFLQQGQTRLLTRIVSQPESSRAGPSRADSSRAELLCIARGVHTVCEPRPNGGD